MSGTIHLVGEELPGLLLEAPDINPVPQGFIAEWGGVMRMARRASLLATEDARQKKLISDPEDSAIMLYTDDPTTALWFLHAQKQGDLRAICKTSSIEGIATVMGENFPPAAFEAERPDEEWPRVAAMFFPSIGEKCPRCRLWRNTTGGQFCEPCETMMQPVGA